MHLFMPAPTVGRYPLDSFIMDYDWYIVLDFYNFAIAMIMPKKKSVTVFLFLYIGPAGSSVGPVEALVPPTR